jgi:hypothetical protein
MEKNNQKLRESVKSFKKASKSYVFGKKNKRKKYKKGSPIRIKAPRRIKTPKRIKTPASEIAKSVH